MSSTHCNNYLARNVTIFSTLAYDFINKNTNVPSSPDGSEWMKLTKMMWHFLSPALTNQWPRHLLVAYSRWFSVFKVQQVFQYVMKGLFYSHAWSVSDTWRLGCDLLSQKLLAETRQDKKLNVTLAMWRDALNWSILTCVTFRNN